MNTAPLSIRGLVKIHPGPVCALRGVDLDIPEGMFGLLGPNGAGKSTFMNIVAGLIEPTAGQVHLDGVDVVAHPRYMRERLGYLPQDFGFYPDLTGRGMLEFLLKMKGVTGPKGRRALADELLERVNLTSAATRKVGGYSGGMRQRLGLAQAIAGNPRVLIVDEPTAGLDPEERQRFYRLLAEMSAGRIVLLSTHIVDDVSTLCPRLVVIHTGEVVADTTPSAARNAVDGMIYEGFVADAQLPEFGANHRVKVEPIVCASLSQPMRRCPVDLSEAVRPSKTRISCSCAVHATKCPRRSRMRCQSRWKAALDGQQSNHTFLVRAVLGLPAS